jgi:sterol desaturase/sphingolipid hydroxylase (fatty acid hydroxylase superfamily)
MAEILSYTFDKWLLGCFIVLFTIWEYFKPARRERFTISKMDLIAVFNLTLFSLLCKFALLPNEEWVKSAPLADTPFYIRIIIAIVIIDFLLYWLHRAMHTKHLWKTHWFHHSVEQMNWLKGLYTSATHILMYITPQLMLGYYLFGFSIFEMTCCLVATYFIQLWQHANITVKLGVLEYVLITPQAHRIHHSLNGLRDSNFGALFCIWDRLFGTYSLHQDESFKLGTSQKHGLIRGLLGL